MMREVYKICGSMLMFAGLLLVPSAYGQGGASGAISGSVADTSGATIGGAEVQVGGHHTTTLRAGYGIHYVRENVATVDQLSFQTPFLPVAFGGGLPGCLSTFFCQAAPAKCIPAGSTSNPNGLTQAGALDPAFVPCLSVFQGFPGGDTTRAANFGLRQHALQRAEQRRHSQAH
jgi:hypothetical protein